MPRRDCDANVKDTGQTGGEERPERLPAEEDECPACGLKARVRDDIRGEIVCDDAAGGCGLVIQDEMIDDANPGDWCIPEGGGNPGREVPRQARLPGERDRPATMNVRESIRRGGGRDGKGLPFNGRAGRLGGASKRNERSKEDLYREKMYRLAQEQVGSRNGPMMMAFSAIVEDAYRPQPDESERKDEFGELPLNQTRHMQKVKRKAWQPPGGYQERVSTTAALIIAGRVTGKGYDHLSAMRRYDIRRDHLWKEVKNIQRRIGRLRRVDRAATPPDFDAMNTRLPEAMLALDQMTQYLDRELPALRRDIERVVRLAMMELGLLRGGAPEALPSVKPRALVGSLALLEFERLGIDRQKSGLSDAVHFSVTQIRNTLSACGDVLREAHEKAAAAAA